MRLGIESADVPIAAERVIPKELSVRVGDVPGAEGVTTGSTISVVIAVGVKRESVTVTVNSDPEVVTCRNGDEFEDLVVYVCALVSRSFLSGHDTAAVTSSISEARLSIGICNDSRT